MISPTDSAGRWQAYGLVVALASSVVGARIVGVERICEPAQFRKDPGLSASAILAPLAGAGPLHLAALAAAGQNAGSGPTVNDRRGVWPARRPEPVPTLGVNDRSRWLTVRSLVDDGTYAIGRREIDPLSGRYWDRGAMTEEGWYTMDKILVPGPGKGDGTFYSSKPPFLPTIVAGLYWLLRHALHWSITAQRWQVIPTILLMLNWLPFVVYLTLLARLVERFGTTDWGRLYVVAVGGFATFVTSFSACLNNHTVAAWGCLFALYPALRILQDGDRRKMSFILAGFFAGFTACSELPAAAFAACLGLLLACRAVRPTVCLYIPAVAVPVAAFLITNYLAIGRLTPAYSEVAGPWYGYPGSYWEKPLDRHLRHGIDWASEHESRATYALNLAIGHHGFFSLTPAFLLSAAAMIGALGFVKKGASQAMAPGLATIMILTVVVSLIVFTFYVYFAGARNYGGVTHGPRWLIWLTPLWLVALQPAADRLAASSAGRGLGYVLLGISIFSVNYPPWTPWHHPWIYDCLEARGWIPY